MSGPEIVRQWIDERVDLREMFAPLMEKTVPRHRFSHWYLLGGVTLFLFGVQVCTGLLLLLYYRPSMNEAYESVQYITNRVAFGWLVRSVHAWSANLMIFMAFAHMFSVAFLRAYRKPREMTWMSGMILLFLSLGFGFSGYLLPWNTLSFFATKVGTEVPGRMPVIGHATLLLMRGGEDVGAATLARFFSLHVVVLPAITASAVLLHLLLVQNFGMSIPPSVEQERPRFGSKVKFFPNYFLRDVMTWSVALVVLLLLAALYPAELGKKADPFGSAPAGIKPEWYFLSQFQTLRMLPSTILHVDGEVIGALAFGLAGAMWVALPLLEGCLGRYRTRWARVAVIGGFLYLASTTLYAYFTS